MRTPRALLAAGLAVCLAVPLAACSGGDEVQDAVGLVGDVDGVASVRAVAHADDPGTRYLEVTLDDGRSAAQVRESVHRIQTGLTRRDDLDVESVLVTVDGFRAAVEPRPRDDAPDTDLERALWLREDGRATGFGPSDGVRPVDRLDRSGSDALVTARPADVVDLALDLDAAVPGEGEVDRTLAVGSEDGSVRVQWGTDGGGLDREATEALAALQERYPGTTGWFDDETPGAGVHLDDADLPLARAVAAGPGLVDGLLVAEVGWGPLRAQTFPELGRTARRLGPALDRLRALPAVRAVTPDGVQVEDVETLDAVRRLLPEETVQLVREPGPIGEDPYPLFEVGELTNARQVALWEQLVPIDGFRAVDRVLVLESDVDDDALAAIFALARPRVGPVGGLYVSVGAAPVLSTSDLAVLGELQPDGELEATPPEARQPVVTDDLVARVAEAWAAAPTS